MDGLISVIVPVYNVEEYLERCLASLQNQSYKNIEVIMIDDCSTDHSVQVANRYTMEDSRFKLLQQEVNQGATAARARGVMEASGQYIMFVDSDDWIAENCCAIMLSQLEKCECDILQCRYIKTYGESNVAGIKSEKVPETFDSGEAIRQLYGESEMDKFNYLLHCKIYKKELWDGVPVPEDNFKINDVPFIPIVFAKAKKLASIEDGLYYYFQRNNENNKSTMDAIKSNYFTMAYEHFKAFRFVSNYFRDTNEELCNLTMKYALVYALSVLKANHDRKSTKEARNEIKNAGSKALKYLPLKKKSACMVLEPSLIYKRIIGGGYWSPESEGLISVIVPVYNVEKYLDACLENIVNQTYKKLEIILVNDCATDDSLKICEAFAKFDDRIRVINHESNLGLSEARNTGLQYARGEFITYVDSDDVIALNFCEVMIETITKAGTDIVQCGYTIVPDEWNKIAVCAGTKDFAFKSYSNAEAVDCCYGNGDKLAINFMAWGKLYKHAVIGDTLFMAGLKCEDAVYNSMLLINGLSVGTVNFTGYYYRQRQSSIMGEMKTDDTKLVINHCIAYSTVFRYADMKESSMKGLVANALCQWYLSAAKRFMFVKENTKLNNQFTEDYQTGFMKENITIRFYKKKILHVVYLYVKKIIATGGE